MKKFFMAMFSLLLLFNAAAVSANSEIPEGAQNYADKYFIQILQEHLKSPHAGGYNLNPDSQNITFGPLHPTYALTEDFVKNRKIGAEGILQTTEYLSVVYQDGNPVNVIGTYQTEAGTWDMSTLGYGLELAMEMDKLKAGESILSEPPIDAWYVYDGNKVKPLTKYTKDLKKEEKNVKDYQSIVVDRYKDSASGPDMGGGSGIDSANGSSAIMIALYSVIGLLGLGVIFLFLNNRKLKNQL